MMRKEAVGIRRKGERTVKYIAHAPLCLYSSGLFIPPYPCTCGSKRVGWCNVMKVAS